jgi:hypothetical protein
VNSVCGEKWLKVRGLLASQIWYVVCFVAVTSRRTAIQRLYGGATVLAKILILNHLVGNTAIQRETKK